MLPKGLKRPWETVNPPEEEKMSAITGNGITQKEYKRRIWGWTMYDWANSAFATTIMAAVLPVYYADVAGANLSGNQATVYWGYTTSIALLLVAIVSPVLGAMADFKGAKKRYLTIFALVGIFGTTLLFFV
jgi:UMF1 family MFS transporter